MACFDDLPYELQSAIWLLVLPNIGGAHWVEFEGITLPPKLIQDSVARSRDLFGDTVPTERQISRAQGPNEKHRAYYMQKVDDRDESSPFFQIPYTIVPSVWGQCGKPAAHENESSLPQDLLDEIAETRRCRQVSTYTQVSTLLSMCRVSRQVAEGYLAQRASSLSWPLWRGWGPLSRPRPIRIWEQLYENLDTAPELPDGRKLIPPVINPALDLVILRLHTASGHPTQSLIHAPYQLIPDHSGLSNARIGWYPRIGIEWHSLWASEAGRLEFCRPAVHSIVQLLLRAYGYATIFLLVDGIPRPQWNQYPPIISSVFTWILDRERHILFDSPGVGDMSEAQQAQFRDSISLHQEFEANGRRYYVVFVVSHWPDEAMKTGYEGLKELDPESIESGSPFPGGESLWPETLRDPVRFAHRYWHVERDYFASRFRVILSWEPI